MKTKNILRKLIAIVGPTGSGKTSLGVLLAKKFDGEIVSADSRQVYRGLDIGTGKEGQPWAEISKSKAQNSNKQIINQSINQLANCRRVVDGISQWMIDICDPEEKFTLFDYLSRARLVIDNIFSRGKIPIVVGGTGLYVQGLIEGFELEKLQTSNLTRLVRGKPRWKSQIYISKLKKYSRTELDKMSLSRLQDIVQKLKAKSPDDSEMSGSQSEGIGTNKLDMNNPHRLIRFIEKTEQGLKPTKKKPDFMVLQIGLDSSREELFDRIDWRVDQWLEHGFIKEVQGLIDAGVDPKWLLGLGLEYRVMTEYVIKTKKPKKHCHCEEHLLKRSVVNRLSCSPKILLTTTERDNFESMKQDLKYKIHQYARRQLTWFRRFSEINWLKTEREAEILIKKYL